MTTNTLHGSATESPAEKKGTRLNSHMACKDGIAVKRCPEQRNRDRLVDHGRMHEESKTLNGWQKTQTTARTA